MQYLCGQPLCWPVRGGYSHARKSLRHHPSHKQYTKSTVPLKSWGGGMEQLNVYLQTLLPGVAVG